MPPFVVLYGKLSCIFDTSEWQAAVKPRILSERFELAVISSINIVVNDLYLYTVSIGYDGQNTFESRWWLPVVAEIGTDPEVSAHLFNGNLTRCPRP